ncbi:uncharacterized protein LOC129583203 [Paramacrobiotus metropolitanus]|uniref:uncharacterized protein LOC129583203 n=1 Tax=Paramacrobiotus metropolitanus TaxID=2943436 RepID=UPI002445A826|nr:uncharacterized protein LOC129583203 [Paramacrobiotus metropolitanus]
MATGRKQTPAVYQEQEDGAERKSALIRSISMLSAEERSLLPVVANAPNGERELSRQEITVIVVCSCTTVVVNLGVGSMPLLIPIEIVKKNYAYTWTGVLFLLYGINVATCELLQSKIVPFLGTKRAFLISSSILAACYASFGLLDLTSEESVFAGLACFIRIIEGLCYSGIMNAVFTILCLTVPTRAILGISLIDGLTCVGYSLGPLFSGILFEISGFILPYIIIAALMAVCSIMGTISLPPVAGNLAAGMSGPLKVVSRDAQFYGCTVVAFAMGNFVGFMEATLEVYLAQFDRGSTVEGAVFFAMWFSAAVVSPLWGYILRKAGNSHVFLLAGPFIEATVFIFFGPLPGLDAVGRHLGLSITCLIIMAATTSMSLLASINIMIERAENDGIETSIHTYAFISAIWLTSLYFGEAIGAIISGSILDKYDYGCVAISAVVTELLLGILASALILLPWKKIECSV